MASTVLNYYSYDKDEKSSDFWDCGRNLLDSGRVQSNISTSPLDEFNHTKYMYELQEQNLGPNCGQQSPQETMRCANSTQKIKREMMYKSGNDYQTESALLPDYNFGNWDLESKTKDSNSIHDLSIQELFGLKYSRGSLMENQTSQNANSVRHSNQNQSNVQYYQRESDYIQDPDVTSPNVPSTPTSLSVGRSSNNLENSYSNSYNMYASGSNFSQMSSYDSSSPSSAPTKRSHFPPCPTISNTAISHSNHCGRAIRGSPTSSDASSKSAEFCATPGFRSSRSNSPDSDYEYHNQIDLQAETELMNELSFSDNCRRDNRRLYPAKKYPTPSHHHNKQQNYHSHNNSRSSAYYSPLRTPKNNYMSPEDRCCSNWGPLVPYSRSSGYPDVFLDQAVMSHRKSAGMRKAVECEWEGELPSRNPKPCGYSSKVFIGGIPYDINEQTLINAFKQFGHVIIDWPGKDAGVEYPEGFAYVIFESEKQVKTLLSCCTRDYSKGGTYHYKISSRKQKSKRVEVIPWGLNESNDMKSSSQKLDPHKTIFVGALHGMITAPALTKIMDELFGGVVYTGIDTDKYKYPIGSARVTFDNMTSYLNAVRAAFAEIKTPKFRKTVQIDPYLEDAICNVCRVQQGPYFCRNMMCYQYFCRNCWILHHSSSLTMHHKPLNRGSKNNHIIGMSPKINVNHHNRRNCHDSQLLYQLALDVNHKFA